MALHFFTSSRMKGPLTRSRSKVFPILELPGELRNLVYEEHASTITVKMKNAECYCESQHHTEHRRPFALLESCRQVYNEACTILPSVARYRIDIYPHQFCGFRTEPPWGHVEHVDIYLHWAATRRCCGYCQQFQQSLTQLRTIFTTKMPALKTLHIAWVPAAPSCVMLCYTGVFCQIVDCSRCSPEVGPTMRSVFNWLRPMISLRNANGKAVAMSLQRGSAVTREELVEFETRWSETEYEMPKCKITPRMHTRNNLKSSFNAENGRYIIRLQRPYQ